MRHKQDDRHYEDLAHAEHTRQAAAHGLTAESSARPVRWWRFRRMATGALVATWYPGRRLLHSPAAGLIPAASWGEALAAVVRLERHKA
jgi:hypothetical protein